MATLESISKEFWFHGLLPREDVKMLIVKNGDFLVRMTEPTPGQTRQFVLSVMQSEGEENNEGMHYVIRTHDGMFSVTEKMQFENLPDLIANHKLFPITEENPKSILITPIGRQKWELNHEDVTMTKTLGEGAFGEVKLGSLKMETETVKVAVKVAKLEKCTKEQIKEIMTEARLMRNFDHRNVVRCYGVAAVEEPLLVVMELVQGGGLDGYLKKNQVNMMEKMDIVAQVASGLAYIHKMNIMHRDIASRNVLYGNGTAKVSDFGLSRVGTSYQMDPNKKAPIRWLSPETLSTFTYTQLTDVFAFGVLCWEVIENGAQPYPGLSVAEVHQKVVKDDYRMTISDKVPIHLQDMIKKCWLKDTNERLTMEQCRQISSRFDKRVMDRTKTLGTPSASDGVKSPPLSAKSRSKAKNRSREKSREKASKESDRKGSKEPDRKNSKESVNEDDEKKGDKKAKTRRMSPSAKHRSPSAISPASAFSSPRSIAGDKLLGKKRTKRSSLKKTKS